MDVDVVLQSPNPPVNMLSDDYVSPRETTMVIQCHDRIFKDVTALDDDGQPLFKVEGTSFGTSWSWRRKLFDGTGRYVYDFRHHNFDVNNGWVVEDAQGNRFCTLEHTSFLKKGHAAVTAKVRTTAGEDVLVEMEPRDRGALSTTVQVGGSTIATITKIADNQHLFANPADRSVWQVRVAAGVDLGLIMAIAMCRAESSHVWKD